MGIVLLSFTIPVIISIITTAALIWFIIWLVRRIRKKKAAKKESYVGEYMDFVDVGRFKRPTEGKCKFCP